MRKLVGISFGLLLGISSPDFSLPASSLRTDDAVILTLRLQKTEIFLDSTLLNEIQSSLALARGVNDSLVDIHAFPDYVPNQLILSSSASWTQSWRKGNLVTGNAFIDTFSAVYRLKGVDTMLFGSSYVLTFEQPLQIVNLSKLYSSEKTVAYAEPNGYVGDGDDIRMFKKNGEWDVAFSIGRGDCPAGCIYRYYWYVAVHDSMGQLLEGCPRKFTPTIYRWNIPPRYSPTYFPTVSALLDNAKNATDWWVRQFALESLGILFFTDYPEYATLKNEATANKGACIETLRKGLDDPDDDVRSSASRILAALVGNGNDISSYFPFRAGNRWVWSHRVREDSSESIIDSVQRNGHEYFRFTHLRELDTALVRFNEKSQVVMYTDSGEVVWLDFGLKIGDKFKVGLPGALFSDWWVTLRRNDDTVSVGGIRYTHCFRFDATPCCDRGWIEWFAPGIGPIRRIQITIAGGIPYELSSAHVAGSDVVLAFNDKTGNAPMRFSLSQNFPNPFNPSTTFQYELAETHFVTLKVYDLLGREVATLVNERRPQGTYTVRFDASKFSSGSYFCKLTVDGAVVTKKMTLLR